MPFALIWKLFWVSEEEEGLFLIVLTSDPLLRRESSASSPATAAAPFAFPLACGSVYSRFDFWNFIEGDYLSKWSNFSFLCLLSFWFASTMVSFRISRRERFWALFYRRMFCLNTRYWIIGEDCHIFFRHRCLKPFPTSESESELEHENLTGALRVYYLGIWVRPCAGGSVYSRHFKIYILGDYSKKWNNFSFFLFVHILM